MANPLFVKDSRILWLKVPKTGTPPMWQPGFHYRVGDSVVPTDPPPELADFMFICCGFVGASGVIEPIFPTVIGNTIADGKILWKCRDPSLSPEALGKNEYFLIDQVVTVT